MREMTQEERLFAYSAPDYRCCFCGTVGLTEGPRGGMSMNRGCVGCGARFNLVHPSARERYGEGIAMFGQVIENPKRPYKPVLP